MISRGLPSISIRMVFGVWVALGSLSARQGGAEEIYKCLSPSGKPAFVSNPSGFRECQPLNVKVDEPNPADVARALEERRRKDEEARIAEEKAREEREIRARERQAEAEIRRARAAEEELRLLKQRQTQSAPTVTVPVWPIPVPIVPHPHKPHPHFHDGKKDVGPAPSSPPEPPLMPSGRP